MRMGAYGRLLRLGDTIMPMTCNCNIRMRLNLNKKGPIVSGPPPAHGYSRIKTRYVTYYKNSACLKVSPTISRGHMKTILQGAFALCLLTALMLAGTLEIAHAQAGSIQSPTTPAISPTPAPHLAGTLDLSAVSTLSFAQIELPKEDASNTYFNDGSGNAVLHVSGAGEGPQEGEKEEPLRCTVTGWRRPEHPDQVRIVLTAADKSVWVAEWRLVSK